MTEQPNLEQARRFLELLDEEADRFTYQFATDDPVVKRTYQGKDPLAAHPTLPVDNFTMHIKRNEAGAAVWVMVNEGDGRGRKAQNVTRVRAVFADVDGQVPLDRLISFPGGVPHIIVESSPGHYQSYWLVDGLAVDQFEGVQRRIAKTFGTDPVVDPCRVMRLPGFFHVKDPEQPFQVRIVHVEEGLPYPEATILKMFPPLEAEAKLKSNGHAHEGSADLPPPLDPDRVQLLRAKHPKAFDLDHHDGDDSRRDLALAGAARREGWSKEDAAALICTVRTDGKEKRVDYLWRTVEKAYAESDGGNESADAEPEAEPKEKKKSAATKLVEIADDADLFHASDQTAYADIHVDGHRETWPVRSRGFRRWLSRRFYEVYQAAPNAQGIQDALAVIEAKAHFDGGEHHVHLRVAEENDRIYLDLADEGWHAVEISADGWRGITDPPVRFRRAAGMLPLPVPERGGSIDDLRRHLNVRNEDDFVLVVSWLLAALRARGPYPVLALAGEQGSAKSTTSAILRSLIDSNSAPLRALPREDRDLFIAATNAYSLAFDNVSGLAPWISDTLCRLATGGGFAVRQLYTDSDEILFDAMRPVLLNGIDDVVTRPDLADRAIFITLEPIPDERRRHERELWAAVHADRPRILGALFDAVSKGLCRLPDAHLERLPRMADFALWATACETSFRPEGTFMKAYEGSRAAATETVIQADPVATAIRDLMTTDTVWTGTAADLLGALSKQAGETITRSKSWPQTARALSGRLRRAATTLRRAGIEVDFLERTMRSRTIVITKTESGGAPPSSPSSPSSPQGNRELSHDGRHDGRPTDDGRGSEHDGSAEPTVIDNALILQTNDGHDGNDGHVPSDSDDDLPPWSEGEI